MADAGLHDYGTTREKIIALIDDIEIVAKEIIDTMLTLRHQRTADLDPVQLIELLTAKETELKNTLKIASEQANVQVQMDELQRRCDKKDQEILQLQKHLKDAEHKLNTALFQAKQKLHSIERANTNSVSSEELIKYAHRISASNAVAAPQHWFSGSGDPRRPYPQDIEMRQGFLGQVNDTRLNMSSLQHQASVGSDSGQSAGRGSVPHTPTSVMPMSWNPPPDYAITRPTGPIMPAPTIPGDMKELRTADVGEDVEVMSSDSTSSSSSDSQ